MNEGMLLFQVMLILESDEGDSKRSWISLTQVCLMNSSVGLVLRFLYFVVERLLSALGII
jgi:hypothetical protein